VEARALGIQNFGEMLMNTSNYFCFFFITFLMFSEPCFSEHVAIQPEKSVIKIGMTTALSGPAQALGEEVKIGVETFFARINAEGGVAGHKLTLITLDDQYNPKLAAQNMHLLADEEKILAVIGNVGTPTAEKTVPIANERKILLFGAFTGGNVLRKTPPDRYVINLRAGYAEEAENMVKGLLSIGVKPDDFAFFLQHDNGADAGYFGALNALIASGYNNTQSLPVGRYTRNTLNVEGGMASLIAAGKSPKAILMVGAYAPIAKFIMLAKKAFPSTLFLNVSFVGSSSIIRLLGADSDNIIFTQVVPSPKSDLTAAQDYREDLNKYSPGSQPSYGSFEGYLDAKLFVVGLTEAIAKNALTREGLVDAFESLKDIDIGIGLKISFDKNNHQALHTIWPTIIKNGQIEPLDWSKLKMPN